jgi:hypothetical protein
MKKIFLIIAISSNIVACSGDKKEDIVNEVPKDGSIETAVKVEHLNDSMDILITKHTVNKNAATTKSILKTDTIPTLGFTTVQDEKGQSKTVKKDYDIYITVK